MQKLDKLYGGGSSGSKPGSYGPSSCYGGCSSRGSGSSSPLKAGSAGTERGAGSAVGGAANRCNHSSGSQRPAYRNGAATAPTTVGNPRQRAVERERREAQAQAEAAAAAAHRNNATSGMLRIPQELRPGGGTEQWPPNPHAALAAHAAGLAAGVSGGGLGMGGGGLHDSMGSPLPFESSLAPDFLALFAGGLGWES